MNDSSILMFYLLVNVTEALPECGISFMGSYDQMMHLLSNR
jgi:hypothetical protein